MLSTYPENLSQSFTLSQLTATSYPIANTPDPQSYENLKKMAEALELLKARLGPFTIASGYRSKALNDAVGGASTSRHLFGDAVDISPSRMRAEEYWARILGDDSLKNLFGEISWKKYQTNAVHLSLPFWQGIEWVQGSARIADLYSGKVVYVRQSPEQVNQYLVKYGLRSDPNAVKTLLSPAAVMPPSPASLASAPAQALEVAKKMVTSPVFLASLALGGGLLVLLSLRKKSRA